MMFEVTCYIEESKIRDLLRQGAIGIEYWGELLDSNVPGMPFDKYSWDEAPFYGGKLTFKLDADHGNNAVYSLERADIRRGLALLATKEPRHWMKVMEDSIDQETGDVFIQLCLFGEILFS